MALIYLHNTLSGKKEEFRPISHDVVKMYSCGPTVYSEQHIGNMRPYVFVNVLYRTLKYNGYNVKQVMNITDVGHMSNDDIGGADTGEDKMEKAAKSSGTTAQEIAKKITEKFLFDLEQLSIDTSIIQIPRATEYISEQIAIIKTLEQKGYTYKISDGIYFDTRLFKDYGKLGNINIKGLMEGARVDVNEEKHNPTDFALWKFSNQNENRQQEWESPWGVGFPGWHIECSAMSRALLGTNIDIHTGGVDHIPIHHNNEIAQSECSTGKKFVNYWLHSAYIVINSVKIAKSVGNTIYLRELPDKNIYPLAYRYWLLTGHYKTQMNFTWEALDGANTAFKKLHKYVRDNLSVENGEIDQKYLDTFTKYINDDLNTPKAIALLWELIKDDSVPQETKRSTLLKFDSVLGLDLIHAKKSASTVSNKELVAIKDISPEIQQLLKARDTARKNKDFTKSDDIRNKIKDLGYMVEDTTGQTLLYQL